MAPTEAIGSVLEGNRQAKVVVSEVTNEEVAVAHALATNSLGNVRSITMRAFTPAEFAEIVKKIS